MNKLNTQLQRTPIAVIGMASMFADAENLERYWENIIKGIDSIKEVPDDRWKISDYYDPDPSAPDKTYCKRGGFLPDIDFDPLEFGLPPKLLESTDTSQLLSLAVARDALLDAGYAPGSSHLSANLRERTGVIIGVGGGQKLILPLGSRLQSPVWRKALASLDMSEEQIDLIIEKIKAAYIPWTEDTFPGLLGNVIAGRIANRFDLNGINSVVDAACAASLSAVKMALSELTEGRCDMMLAGGVDTDNSPFMYMNFSKTPAFSRKGSIRPFDQASDGILIGEGVGMIVCKRLEDAIRDGDRIYATIRGIGSSSDGRYKSVYAPRPQGQALAMQRAYDEAGYEASTVGLIEAHGTGTVAGDQSEIESVKMVFGKNNLTPNHIALGSVKSQIGHTKAAAGIAGLIKTALALHHKILPGTINVSKPNPSLDIGNSPLYINRDTRPWFRKSALLPRRAGVSAFGFGGVNLHVAMEEFTEEQENNYRKYSRHHLILLQGKSTDELKDTCQHHLARLREEEAYACLKELAHRSGTEAIPENHVRLGFVAASVDEAIQKLALSLQLLDKNVEQESWEHPLEGIWFRQSAASKEDKVVALFAGQGSQYVNMGNELACDYPTLRESFQRANLCFEAKGQKALTQVVYPAPHFSEEEREAQEEKLKQTEYAQAAIGALSAGMYRLLKAAGFDADFFAGHSYGELSALWAAGVLDEDAYYNLTKARGEAMASAPTGDKGTMLAVKGNIQSVQSMLSAYEDVSISNINSGTQIILGGSSESLKELQSTLKSQGYICSLLPVSAAFHTTKVAHAHPPFSAALQQVHFSPTSKKVFSNTTGNSYPDTPQQMKSLLADQILKPVLFKAQIENIYAQGGRVFVEFGPKNILTGLVREILEGKLHKAIALNANPKKAADRQFREAVIQLAVLGISVQGFDHFAESVEKPKANPKKLNIRLNGSNYISEATLDKYKQLLSKNTRDPETIKEEDEARLDLSLPHGREAPDQMHIHSNGHPSTNHQQKEEIMLETQVLNKIQADIAQLAAQQNKIVEMLETLMQASADKHVLGPQPTIAPASNGVAHAPLSSNGKNHSPEEVTEAVDTTQEDTNRKLIEESLLQVVADKTGYPAEMLELSMDMEADLGIDSIKRVEIFGTMTEANPSVQGVNPQELAELRTLQQIVDYLVSKMSELPASDQKKSHP